MGIEFWQLCRHLFKTGGTEAGRPGRMKLEILDFATVVFEIGCDAGVMLREVLRGTECTGGDGFWKAVAAFAASMGDGHALTHVTAAERAVVWNQSVWHTETSG